MAESQQRLDSMRAAEARANSFLTPYGKGDVMASTMIVKIAMMRKIMMMMMIVTVAMMRKRRANSSPNPLRAAAFSQSPLFSQFL